MGLFKNEVGRPSNETLRKRKTIIFSLVALVVVLIGLGVYFGISFFNKKEVNSNGMNITTDNNYILKVNITAYNARYGSSINKSKVNGSLVLEQWRDYPVTFKVTASSSDSSIKSIVWKYNDAGLTKDSSKYKHLNHLVTYNGKSTVDLKYTTSGARYGTVVVTDKKGRKVSVVVAVMIDTEQPVAKVAMSTKNGLPYGIVTCTDKLSGVASSTAYETILTTNKQTNNKTTAAVTLRTAGNSSVTGVCRDKVGNGKSVVSSNVVVKNGVSIAKVKGNPANWTNKDVVLKVFPESNVLKHKYSFDGGKTWQSSNEKKFTRNQTVNIRIKDEDGNISMIKTVKITKIDKTAPVIKITYPTLSNGYYSKAANFKATCSDSGSGVWQMSFGKSKLIHWYSKSSLTHTFKNDSNGNKTLYARCRDKAGNETGWKSYVVKVK